MAFQDVKENANYVPQIIFMLQIFSKKKKKIDRKFLTIHSENLYLFYSNK